VTMACRRTSGILTLGTPAFFVYSTDWFAGIRPLGLLSGIDGGLLDKSRLLPVSAEPEPIPAISAPVHGCLGAAKLSPSGTQA
jgi:hypothetical protein